MLPHEGIHDRARGKWRSILPLLGVPAEFLTGRHGPCPACGGTDRFRFDDKGGRGGYICGQCGSGSGIDLVMRVNRCDFRRAADLVEPLLPTAAVVIPKAVSWDSRIADDLWASAAALNGIDAASKYLRGRGLKLSKPPAMLRAAASVPYKHKDGSKTRHPAMLARFVSPDATSFTTHVTYLDDTGHKAKIDPPRKMAPGKIPIGGAVRLANSADTMGIAEGIETALSAMQIDEIPVWAALSAGLLAKWQPPPTAKHIIVYGDNDANCTGQAAAYALAHRLATDGYGIEVRIPAAIDADWNDVLMSDRERPAQ